jgi:hypothetical protein
MVNNVRYSSPQNVYCRSIADADIDEVVNLLKKGFAAQRSRKFWVRMFHQLAQHQRPAGLPKFGYLLESERRVVGVILQISSTIRAGGETVLRSNVSSWYVEPEFRSYGSLLVSQALKRKDVTYLNISPAPHTYPILAAQGYSRYSNGLFVALPLLSGAPAGAVRTVPADTALDATVGAFDRELVLAHVDCGCISLWCVTADGAYPFVFVPRIVRGVMPCFQLVYCRHIADFVRFARPLGRYLAIRGRPLVIVDASGPVQGLVGRYFDGIRPKYFKGPNAPRLGDLSYTEAAMFGI